MNVPAAAERRATFHEAVADALAARDVRHADLARQLGVTPQAVSHWLNGGRVPAPEQVFEIERVLEVEPGSLSIHLGYLPPDARDRRTYEDVVDADPRLSDRSKQILRLMYRELRGH